MRLARADVTTIVDPIDSLTRVDVVAVTAGHSGTGRFRYRIDAADPFLRRQAPCLRIRTPRPHRAEYLICGDGRVVDVEAGPTGETARVRRPSRSSIVYAVSRSSIGAPSSHRWSVLVIRRHCPDSVCDAAPDVGLVIHRIHVSYVRWAELLLTELQVPRCRNNRVAVLAWQANENTQAIFNPLATTFGMDDAWNFNAVGVKNYVSLGQGLDASLLTLERGRDLYGYDRIFRTLGRCAPPMRIADAIRDSKWCFGCSNGKYVVGVIPSVEADYDAYATREISTA